MLLFNIQVFGKLICGDAEPTPEQEEKNLLSSPEGEDKVWARTLHLTWISILSFQFKPNISICCL